MGRSLLEKLTFFAIAGVGQFADGYLNITIGLVVPMIGYLYFEDTSGSIPAVSQDIMKGSLSLGMIVGQLLFGIFGDAFGRHMVYGKELMLTMLGTLLVITAPPEMSHGGIEAWISVWRVVTGSGIGGDYPMTSSLSAEWHSEGSRAEVVLNVFATHGLGSFAAAIVYLILLAGFKSSVESNLYYLQWVWRLLFGIGLVPCALTLYARLRMPETKPYEEYVANEASGTEASQKRGLGVQFRDFQEYFSHWKHTRTLSVVSSVWFLFDIAFYGINLNQSNILSLIGYGKGDTVWETLNKTALGNLIVSACGFVPGYYAGIFLPDRIGRVSQQFWGCIIVAVLYAIWAAVTNHTSTGGLITLFTLSQFFLNAGPACSTYLIPTEVFPTRVRGTANGIAAASGKAGAVLTSFAFGSATKAVGLQGVLGLFAGILVLCAPLTLWIPETKGRTLDEIERGAFYSNNAIQAAGASSSANTLRDGKV